MLDRDSSEDSPNEACRELLAQLERHNQKEKPIFYEQVDQVLGAPESSKLLELIETGRMPEGWIYRKATGA